MSERHYSGCGCEMCVQADPMFGLQAGYPEGYQCGECGVIFWDGNRQGHYFNGEEIVCPNEDDDDDEDLF